MTDYKWVVLKIRVPFWVINIIPKGPCTQIVYTVASKYPNRDYFY